LFASITLIKHRLGANGLADLLGVDDAIATDRNVGDVHALLFEGLRGIQHRVVLDRRRHHVPARLVATIHDPEDRQVVGFGSTTGEYNLRRFSAD
jgi:hypothetical protein